MAHILEEAPRVRFLPRASRVPSVPKVQIIRLPHPHRSSTRTRTPAFNAAESIISVARSRCSSSTVRLLFSYINNGACVKTWY